MKPRMQTDRGSETAGRRETAPSIQHRDARRSRIAPTSAKSPRATRRPPSAHRLSRGNCRPGYHRVSATTSGCRSPPVGARAQQHLRGVSAPFLFQARRRTYLRFARQAITGPAPDRPPPRCERPDLTAPPQRAVVLRSNVPSAPGLNRGNSPWIAADRMGRRLPPGRNRPPRSDQQRPIRATGRKRRTGHANAPARSRLLGCR